MAEKVLGFRIEVKGTDKQTAKISQLEQSLVKLRQERTRINKKVKAGIPLTNSESKALGTLKTRISQTTKELKKQTNALKVNGKAQAKTTSFTQKMSKSIVSAGAAMFGIGAAIGIATRIVSGAVKIFIDFEKANSKLEAVLGAGEEQMKALSDQAKELGSSTKFTATQVTELQTEFAKLGFPTEEILQMTGATLAGASALGSDLAEQAALTGATLRQFGLDASEAGKVNDVLATAAANSALDFSKLSTALPIVGATAKAVGKDLTQTTALLGKLADRGLDASTSGTSLRNVFLELSKQGLTMDEAMSMINNSTDKAKTSMELFGKRGATTGLILADMEGKTTKLDEALTKTDGAAKRMAETMEDNLAGDITKAGSAWEGFILSLEDGNGVLSKSLRSITQMGTSVLSFLARLNNASAASGSFFDNLKIAADRSLGGVAGIAGRLEATELELTSLDKSFRDKSITIIASIEKMRAARDSGRSIAFLGDPEKFNAELKAMEDKLRAAEDKFVLSGGQLDKLGGSFFEVVVDENQEAQNEIIAAEEKAANESVKINKEANDKKLKQQKDYIAELEKQEAKDLEAEEEGYDKDFELWSDNENKKILAAEQLRKEEKERAELEYQQNVAATTEQNAKDIEDAREQQRLIEEAKKEQIDFGLSSAQQAVSLFSQFQQQAADRQLIKVERNTKKEMDILDKKLEAGVISQEQFDSEKEKLEQKAQEKSAKIKKKAFEQQRTASVIEATIATALSVVQASPVVPLMIAAGAAGAAQIALISSQPTPEFEDGGLVSGASHANGGIQMYHKSGQHLGEMEGNEYIFSRKSVERIGVENLDAMNFGGGTADGFFANGGSVPNVTGLSSSSGGGGSPSIDMEMFANMVSTQMREAIIRTPVINNAVETANVAASVVNTETELSFG